MSLILNPSLTRRIYAWTGWKAVAALKGGQHQHDETEDVYTIWFYDGPEIHICEIHRGSVPEGLDQEQNDADKTDWEAGLKTSSNATLLPRSLDGRPSIRLTATNKTKNFKLRCISFYTATISPGPVSKNPIDCSNYGDVTVTLQKWNGSEMVSAEPADATKTIIDWDPLYAYEIIGGWVDLPTDLKDGTTNAWWLGCVGLPDYAAYGIAVDFVSMVNLEAVSTSRVTSDGRATQYLSPTVVGETNYHTNRLRWVVQHPAGVAKRFQIFLSTFTG